MSTLKVIGLQHPSAASPGITLNASNVAISGLTTSSMPSGSRILLNTLTASSSAALSDLVNLTSAYDDYEIYLTNLLPGTNAVDLALQFHTGSAYLTSGHHNYVSTWYDNNTSIGTGYSNASAHRFMAQANYANSGGGVSGIIKIFGINSSASKKMQFHLNGTIINSGTYGWFGWGGGGHTTTSAIRGFQMYFTSGNIASGTIKIYGIK